jgi:hypothetical protein
MILNSLGRELLHQAELIRLDCTDANRRDVKVYRVVYIYEYVYIKMYRYMNMNKNVCIKVLDMFPYVYKYVHLCVYV